MKRIPPFWIPHFPMHRTESLHTKVIGLDDKKHFHGQRLFSHYRKPTNNNHTTIFKTASTDSRDTMETEKSAVSQVTASPMKPGSEKGTKVPLLRFSARGQAVVPNNENAATLTELSERLSDLEYEGGHSFLKSLRYSSPPIPTNTHITHSSCIAAITHAPIIVIVTPYQPS